MYNNRPSLWAVWCIIARCTENVSKPVFLYFFFRHRDQCNMQQPRNASANVCYLCFFCWSVGTAVYWCLCGWVSRNSFRAVLMISRCLVVFDCNCWCFSSTEFEFEIRFAEFFENDHARTNIRFGFFFIYSIILHTIFVVKVLSKLEFVFEYRFLSQFPDI